MNCMCMETAWGDWDVLLKIERGEEFLQAAKNLSDFMNALNLPVEKHNRLVELTLSQTLAAERNAFFEGCRFCHPETVNSTSISDQRARCLADYRAALEGQYGGETAELMWVLRRNIRDSRLCSPSPTSAPLGDADGIK